MSSAHQLKNIEHTTQAKELSKTVTTKAIEREVSSNSNRNISALAVQLQALRTENSHQSSEIAHLKRQLTILSEFRGFHIKGKELWESRGGNERSFITVLSNIEGAMNHNQHNHNMPSVEDDGDNSSKSHPTSVDYNSGYDLSESANSFNDKLLQNAAGTPSKFEDYDETPFEAIAFLSPKVSELLKEEALALDDVLDTSAWSDSSDSSDDGYGKNRRTRRKRNDDDEDGIDEELAGLEAAGLSLQEELALAANGFADFYGDDGNDDDNNAHGNEESAARLGGTSNNEGWEDSMLEYYQDNRQSSAQTSSPNDSNNGTTTPQQLLSKLKLSYSLADHAVTLDVTRKVSDKGLYTRPLLSRNEIETLGVITLPNWIARPGRVEDSSIDNTSRGREMYMNRILSCTTEYVEPPKSKTLRKLFSGWVPGPGERRPEDEGERRGSRMDGDDDSKLVTAYSPSPNDSADNDDDENDEFEEVRSRSHSRQQIFMEPLPVRTITTRIRPDVLCGSVMTALTTAVEKIGGEITKRQGGHLRAIIPGRKMRVWMPGEWEREQSKIEEDEEHDSEERIRNTSFGSHDDGDSQSVVSMLSSITFSSPAKSPKRQMPTFKVLPPYLVDAQLVTKKLGKECERVLLIRVYRIQDIAQQRAGAEDQEELLDVPAPLDLSSTVDFMGDGRRIDVELESRRSVSALQEVASLVQRLKAVGGEGFAIDQPQPMLNPLDEQDNESVASHTSTKSYLKSFGDAITSPIRYLSGSNVAPLLTSPTTSGSKSSTVMGLMSKELRRKCQASPSVGTYSKSDKSHGLYPCLAKEDAPYVQSSWIFLKVCIEELDQRCLGYSTLGVTPLFESPSVAHIDAIDAHYIAQIKAFCRESMIVSLVKTASELEVYAREQEVSCSNLDHLLRPTFDAYKLAPPPLPKPVPLTAYPLDFQPPEDLCPPWGPEVKKVLEKISNEARNDGTCLSSFERAKRAVSLLVAALQRQNDVEQGARLGRKNMQVMDRLAKMQAHKRNSILKIRDSYGSNLLSTNAADDYHLLRQKSSNAASMSDIIHAIPDQVPLLICNVLVGNAAGTCFVTSSHILFHTQLLPIIGGDKVHLFSIKDVELTINPPSKSLLSPLPASISLTTSISRNNATREEVYQFIPSIGARRFAKFLEVVRDILVENPDTLKLTERGGLVYMYDDAK